MQLTPALNAVLGSVLVVIFIFADYVRKYNSDHMQKNIFCSLLIFTFITITADLFFLLYIGMSGENIRLLINGLCFVYCLFEVLAFYYAILLLDYMIFKDPKRVKKSFFIIYTVTFVHLIILLMNVKWNFYFYIDEAEYVFRWGNLYFIRIIFSYCPAFFVIYEMIVCRKMFKSTYLFVISLLLGLVFIGSSIDLAADVLKLIWPCMTAALLCFYFYIIHNDTSIDSLTGIGNRYSFNEFTDKLSRSSTGESWAIVMIDLDHFKEINDTLGHQEGDNALRDMASIIKSCIRRSDFAARYGGDEFVLATGMENGITVLMKNIQDAINLHNENDIRPFKIEISYGFDVYTTGGSRTIDEFLTHIDSLMYRNKEERRRASDKKPGGQE